MGADEVGGGGMDLVVAYPLVMYQKAW